MRRHHVLAAAAALSLLVSPRLASQDCGVQILPPQGLPAGATFGDDVALVRERAVVGAPDAGTGQVSVLERSGMLLAQLMASDGQAGAGFGEAVDGEGQYIAVGAPGQDGGVGAAYVYTESLGGFAEERLMPVGLTGLNDAFGASLDMDLPVLVVGANSPGSSPSVEFDQGAAYVFELGRAGWEQTARLVSPTPPVDVLPSRRFGSAVSVDGDRMAVGEPGRNFFDPLLGQVHLFVRTRDGWELEQSLQGFETAGSSSPLFGIAVALERELLAVGAPGNVFNPFFEEFGHVLVYRLEAGTWVLDADLSAPFDDEGSNDRFGASVGLDAQGRLFVGATRSDASANGGGQVYVYERDDAGAWQLTARFRHQPAVAGAALGGALDVSGSGFVAGVEEPGFGTLAFANAGVVRVDGPDYAAYAWQPVGDALPPTGLPDPTLEVDGVLCAGNQLIVSGDFGVDVSGGMLFLGRTAGFTPLRGGVLVPTVALALSFASFDGAFELSFVAPAVTPPGLELWLQAWALSPQGPQGAVATAGAKGTTP